MTANIKRLTKIKSLIAIVIVISMLVMPLAAFAEDQSGGDSSSSGDSTSVSSESSSSDSSGSENTEAKSFEGDESSKTETAPASNLENEPVKESDEETNNNEETDLESKSSEEKSKTTFGSGSEGSESVEEVSDEETFNIAGSESEEDSEVTSESIEEETFTGNTYAVVVQQNGGEGLNEPVEFTVTFTEIGSSRIGSVEITVPDDFTSLSDLDWSTSYGTKLDGQWDGEIIGNVVTLWAKTVEQYLYFGQWVMAVFKANSPAAIDPAAQWKDDSEVVINENVGIYSFGAKAWTNALDENDQPLLSTSVLEGAKTGNQLNTFSEEYSQIKVWVLDTGAYNSQFQTQNIHSNSYPGQVSYSAVLESITGAGSSHTFLINFHYYRQPGAPAAQNLKKIEVDIPSWLTVDPNSLSSGWSIVSGKIIWTGNIDHSTVTPISLSFSGTLGQELQNPYILTTGAYWYAGGYKPITYADNGSQFSFQFPYPDLPEWDQPESPDAPIDEIGYPDDEPEDETDPVVTLPGPVPTGLPLAAPLPEPPLDEALADEIVAEALTEVEEVPAEEILAQPEVPQTVPFVEETVVEFVNYRPLLLLLLIIPALLWFLLARLVLVRVPGKEGSYETVARKLARRKEKKWYVEIEKQLSENLAKYGEVAVDFRGGLIKNAEKAIYTGETVLSAGDKRYAVINKQRFTSWLDELQEEVAKTA